MKRLERDAAHPVNLTLNGARRRADAEPRMLLSDFLRHRLGQTGTHVGCEHGVCGACTVLIDGVAARSCLTLAVQVDGRRVDTVEGLSRQMNGAGATAESAPSVDPVELGDLQQAFRRHHALQCGFCTAGILMSCHDFLQRVPDPSEHQVREMLSGHLCRCTGYDPIINAVLDVAAARGKASK